MVRLCRRRPIMLPSRTLLRRAALRAAVICSCALLASCDPLAKFEPQVVSDDQLFAVQATAVTNITASVTYTWTNAQTQARIHHATRTFGEGSASIRILDAAGNLVYSRALEKEGWHTTRC